MNLESSAIGKSLKGILIRVNIILTIFLFTFFVTPKTIFSQSFTSTQITNNSGDDTQVDVCIDSLGNSHLVYYRDGNIYYRYCDGGENFVVIGVSPAIALNTMNKPYIAFCSNKNGKDKVCWVTKQNGSWGDKNIVGNGNNPDIVVDSDGYIHIAYSEISYYWDGDASSIIYTHNRGGVFVKETIFQGFYDSYLNYTSTTQYEYPAIKIDDSGAYHIASYKYYLYRLWGDTINSDMWINYKTNKNGEVVTFSSPSVTKTSDPFYNKNCFRINDNGEASMVYVFNGNLYYAEVTDTWSENFIDNALQASIGFRDGILEVAYSDPSNQIQYTQKSSVAFSNPSLVSSGQSPVLVDRSDCIYFSKWDGHDLEIYKACQSSILPELVINRDQLNFRGTSEGITTGSQDFLIDSVGEGGAISWSVTDNSPWLDCSPNSGIDSGLISVSVSALPPGDYTGTITVSSPNVSNSPQTISVLYKVYELGQNSAPFGSFATPVHGSTVSSSIPVTGWALDDIAVESVKIYRKNDDGLIYIGDAVFVEGARPDVQQAYSQYPNNYRAGWGYMLLTNFLPNNGNGTFILYAKATDFEGQEMTLGTKTIFCDNTNAVKPFGAIDTPTQGGNTSGDGYLNWGWVLTPQPNSIPLDGQTINVYVDSVSIGHPTYNLYREDIANLFPGYFNSNGAAGFFIMDTTAYDNGIHTISWSVVDSGGNVDGIGSRYFSVQNSGSGNLTQQLAGIKMRQGKSITKREDLLNLPYHCSQIIKIEKGYNKKLQPLIYCKEKKTNVIKIKELEPIVIHIPNLKAGYLMAGAKIYPLPLGSTLDIRKGNFNWIPAPGFYGNYSLIFIVRNQENELRKIEFCLVVVPKFLREDSLN